MTTPILSPPILYTTPELRSNPVLSLSFTKLANEAFSRSKRGDAAKWDSSGLRFPSVNTFYNMLTDGTIVAFIFDLSDPEEAEGTSTVIDEEAQMDKEEKKEQRNEGDGGKGKLIACAAAVPWKGGWGCENSSKESGWEIKAVCVDGDAKYLRRGLALQLLSALESNLIRYERGRIRREGDRQIGVEGKGGREWEREGKSHLSLWIQAAECLNGAYWQKRGYREVRRRTEGVGVWSCRTEFEIVVLRRDVQFDV